MNKANPIYLTTAQLAERFKCEIDTIKSWRYKGMGPAYTRLGGRHILYRLEDVEAYEAQQKIIPSEEGSG